MMKKYSLILFSILLSAFVCVTSASNLSPAQQLSDFLSSYKTFQANYRSETLNDLGQRIRSSQGKVFIERPNFFRWQVEKPSKQILIANKQFFWIYDVDLSQATKQKLHLSNIINPASILAGDAQELIKYFKIERVQNPDDEDEILLQLTPLEEENAGFTKITLRFKNDRLVGMDVTDNLEQNTQYRFSDIKINVSLASDLFNFTPPPGVDVISK